MSHSCFLREGEEKKQDSGLDMGLTSQLVSRESEHWAGSKVLGTGGKYYSMWWFLQSQASVGHLYSNLKSTC